MKRIVVLVGAILLFAVTYSPAYQLDQYFGVTLSLSNGVFNMPWQPVKGSYMHADWGSDGDAYAPDPGPSYPVSEAFDIEGMYLNIDYDASQIVYSIVTSMPNTGFNQVEWYPGYVFRAGDIRFQIGNELYVVGTHEAFTGQLYLNPAMTYRDGHRGFAERGNPTLAASNLGHERINSGDFQFSYSEYIDPNNNPLIENGYNTFIMEGILPFSAIGGAPPQDVSMTLGMSCNNDIATVVAPIPEPGTLVLVGLGLIGLYSGRRRYLK